jgi:hypothetical protein
MIKPHFSFWIAAGLGLLWNLGGCMNYIMQTNPDNVAQMPELYQLIINTRPTWATAAFAIAVFGGAVGCILLLLQRRVAVQILIVSLMGIVITALDTLTRVGMAPSVLLSILVGAALLWYATIATRKNWLK